MAREPLSPFGDELDEAGINPLKTRQKSCRCAAT
jgi:hypothetical protein